MTCNNCGMTIGWDCECPTEYAGARLANAVTLWLLYRDSSAVAGMKLALSEYREAEQHNRLVAEAQEADIQKDAAQQAEYHKNFRHSPKEH